MKLKGAKVRFNYRDYALLPEEKRYEIIDGEMYMAPAPGFAHQEILGTLFVLLRSHVRDRGLGVVVVAPFDVILSEEDIVQPDIVYVAEKRRHIISQRGCEGAPDLVVEVLSPSSAQRDSELKAKLYAKYGVSEYWLVDPMAGTVAVLTLADEGYMQQATHRAGEVVGSRVISGLSVDVSHVFEPS
jgi:Uma2 family endonuclease